eukprot:CAMPEP_0181255318 /NCGR_PEP_ID=MMETSP1096-20121128/49084_1 /TAXON_ID=156174 ORGANISM="Chrysochromulina ericina, Strain CCMP281" /NCGR_SAMPLE_ID=MMETSP1096 /ASSEMBLY_ACC=CAM_ASM_000453 /LENGTH=40 /DNA_ID= /DNA_START= /DNA_END= /DNA_ORIENTATION=
MTLQRAVWGDGDWGHHTAPSRPHGSQPPSALPLTSDLGAE